MVLKFNSQLIRQHGEHAWLYTEAEEEADFVRPSPRSLIHFDR